MTEQEIKKVVLEALASVAPELDEAVLAPEKSFRDQLDIDSMDFLNFVTAIHHRLGIDIPEIEYPKLVTLAGAVSYIDGKLNWQP